MHNTCVQSVRTTWGYTLTKSGVLFTAVATLCSVYKVTLVQTCSFKQPVRSFTQRLYAGKNVFLKVLDMFFTHNPQGLLSTRKGI